MLSLDSPRWNELKHAYGPAADIPVLLKGLKSFPEDSPNSEPWFSIWSALAHQGDVYSASFAALPWIVDVLASDPARATPSFFQFPAWVEICRHKQQVPVPDDMQQEYRAALAQLPDLAAKALTDDRDEGYLRCALSAIAVSKGSFDLAEFLLDMEPCTLSEVKEWMESR